MSNKSLAESILDKVKQKSAEPVDPVLEKYGYKSMDDLMKNPPVGEPEVPETETALTEDEALAEWCRGKQATVIMNPQTLNMQRLHAVIPDRIRDAFRAGFAAGRK